MLKSRILPQNNIVIEYVFLIILFEEDTVCITVLYPCVGADRQAQQDSNTKIHQLYPFDRANSRHITIDKARKLKFWTQLDKYHI